MRGDQPTMIARRCQEKLFTPHARGSIQVNDRFIESTSIYPACAGINPMGMPLATPKKHLPRMRGINPTARSIVTMLCNLPRMRGDQPASGTDRADMPAFTPHARGSPSAYCRLHDFQGFTPRVRGSTRLYFRVRLLVWISPACAGINLSDCPICGCRIHLPRVRGDQPREGAAFEQVFQFTPRARGSTMMLSQLKQRECQRLHKNSIGDIIPIYAE